MHNSISPIVKNTGNIQDIRRMTGAFRLDLVFSLSFFKDKNPDMYNFISLIVKRTTENIPDIYRMTEAFCLVLVFPLSLFDGKNPDIHNFVSLIVKNTGNILDILGMTGVFSLFLVSHKIL